MKVIKTMKPRDNGARKFAKEWGDKLIAVRYRLSEDERCINTTIELVVDQREKAPVGMCYKKLLAVRSNSLVALKVNFSEQELRARLKERGGKWSKQLKLWLIAYKTAVALGLADRIVEGAAEKCTDLAMYTSVHDDYI